MDVRLDHVRAAVQGLGLPAGSAAFHPPDRRRYPRHRRGGSELRRDHVRQGRVRAQAARGLRRAGEFPGRRAEVFRRARVGQRDAGGPAGRAGGDLGSRPGRLVGRMAADGGREHAAAVLLGGRRRPVHRVRGGTGGARHPSGAAFAPHRHRPVRPDIEAGLVRRQRVETDVAGPRTVVPELAGQPRPDLVLVNDDDLTYAKIRLDDHSLRTGRPGQGSGGRGGLGSPRIGGSGVAPAAQSPG